MQSNPSKMMTNQAHLTMTRRLKRSRLLRSKSQPVRKCRETTWSILTPRMIWERLRTQTLHQKTGRIARELSLFAREVSLAAWDILLKICRTWSPTRRWSRRLTGRMSRMLSMRCASRSRATIACSLNSASRRTSSCGYQRARLVPQPSSRLLTSTRVTSSNLQAIAWSTVDHSFLSTKALMDQFTCVWWKNFWVRCLTLPRITQRASLSSIMFSLSSCTTVAFGSALIKSWTSTRRNSPRRMTLRSSFLSRSDQEWPFSQLSYSMGLSAELPCGRTSLLSRQVRNAAKRWNHIYAREMARLRGSRISRKCSRRVETMTHTSVMPSSDTLD